MRIVLENLEKETHMSFQGHIENGTIVLDESVFLPNGTLVRIKPVTSRENTESLRPVVADNDQPRSFEIDSVLGALRGRGGRVFGTPRTRFTP